MLDENSGFFDSMVVFIKGSLIFTVSQAWNSAIQDLLEKSDFFKNYGKLAYALLITVMAVYTFKVISNLKRLIETCKNSMRTSDCFEWKKILIGGSQLRPITPSLGERIPHTP